MKKTTRMFVVGISVGMVAHYIYQQSAAKQGR